MGRDHATTLQPGRQKKKKKKNLNTGNPFTSWSTSSTPYTAAPALTDKIVSTNSDSPKLNSPGGVTTANG